MNPLANIGPRTRIALYVIFGLGSIVLGYTGAKGWTGTDEFTAWSALSAFFGLTAAANVDRSDEGGDH